MRISGSQDLNPGPGQLQWDEFLAEPCNSCDFLIPNSEFVKNIVIRRHWPSYEPFVVKTALQILASRHLCESCTNFAARRRGAAAEAACGAVRVRTSLCWKPDGRLPPGFQQTETPNTIYELTVPAALGRGGGGVTHLCRGVWGRWRGPRGRCPSPPPPGPHRPRTASSVAGIACNSHRAGRERNDIARTRRTHRRATRWRQLFGRG